MAYPSNYDSFTPVKRTGDTITENITIPASAWPVTVNTTYPILRNVSIPGYVEVSTVPVIGQFRVYYRSNQIVFGPVPNTTVVSVSYVTTGTLLSEIPFQAIINAIIAIEQAIGLNPGGSYSTLVDRIVALESQTSHSHKVYDATAACNGSNTTFTLPDTPTQPEATLVVLNGSVLNYNVDYTISGANVILPDPPSSGDTLFIYYVV